MTKPIIIGSRGSDLALWQANFFQSQLNDIEVKSEIKIITTRGDRIQHLSFDKLEGKGFFTKEIESALLSNEIDVAIHSHKDLETKQPLGLRIGGVSYRENPAELLLIRKDALDLTQPFSFKHGAIIGTSSARRKSQVLDFRPDIQLKDIRGNVPTRIEKLRSGEFDAILLAAAGVIRLNLDLKDLVVIELDPRLFVPAAAQGVLAYQCREGDDKMYSLLQQLHHQDVASCIEIERNILSDFGGGCHIPIGVYATRIQDAFHVRVAFGEAWEEHGTRIRFTASNAEEAMGWFNAVKNGRLPRNVLITKDLSENSFLKRAAAAHNIELEERPMISIKTLPFEFDQNIDWIFFSSKNGVRAFFDNCDVDLSAFSFAAFGESTARALAAHVKHVDFVAKLGQPDEVAREFADHIGSKRVLFPTSSISNKNMSMFLDKDQYDYVSVYETLISPTKFHKNFEAVIFTSPSNVDGFAELNDLTDVSRCLAIGNSTAEALKKQGIDPEVADFAHEAELFTLLCS